jgi:hypothetical protein
MRDCRALLLIAVACGLISFVAGVVKVDGTLAGGEVARGKWSPNYSILQPFKKKVDKISNGRVEKIHNFLENIHVPGCSFDVVVRIYIFDSISFVKLGLGTPIFWAAGGFQSEVEEESPRIYF